MTSAAQVQANRSNAQKSTGPRTPEGKATVAQNAVKHGLLAQEVVIKGEDPGEFEFYRDQMLAELAPAGQMESMLAHRIVGLSWRLRRAERLQAAAFDKLEDPREPDPLPPEVASRLLAELAAMDWHPPVPPAPAFGRRAVKDFSQERLLDRLLVYERRIEHSLYRTMGEFRKQRLLRAENPPTGDVTTGTALAGGEPVRDQRFPVSDEVGRGRPTYQEPPDGGTTNGAEAQGQACETNPNCAGVSSVKSEVPSNCPILPTSNFTLPTSHFPLETSDEPPEGGTPNVDGDESCETNPISGGVSSVKYEVSSEQDQASNPPASSLTLPTSDSAIPTGDEPARGAGTNLPQAPEPACETNPIREPGSTPSNTSSQPRRVRMFPNTDSEMTYDSYLGKWVLTSVALGTRDSNQANGGRRE